MTFLKDCFNFHNFHPRKSPWLCKSCCVLHDLLVLFQKQTLPQLVLKGRKLPPHKTASRQIEQIVLICLFNLPCSSLLDWCFAPSLHWTLWTDHEQLIRVRHSISREETEYWHVISLYQSVHCFILFLKHSKLY